MRSLRMHGDCHLGNILWNTHGPVFVDFDDCLSGPAIQDLWMLCSGSEAQQQREWTQLLEGYEQFCEFDYSELQLVEPLRAMRMLNHAAWLAARWTDPAFPGPFPGSASRDTGSDILRSCGNSWKRWKIHRCCALHGVEPDEPSNRDSGCLPAGAGRLRRIERRRRNCNGTHHSGSPALRPRRANKATVAAVREGSGNARSGCGSCWTSHRWSTRKRRCRSTSRLYFRPGDAGRGFRRGPAAAGAGSHDRDDFTAALGEDVTHMLALTPKAAGLSDLKVHLRIAGDDGGAEAIYVIPILADKAGSDKSDPAPKADNANP